MGQNDKKESVVSEEELEKSFTDALADLSKAIESPELQKAGGKKKAEKEEEEDVEVNVDTDGEDEGDGEEEDDKEDDSKSTKKSLNDLESELRKSEDDEVSGALDVSPLLQNLVKAIDDRDSHLSGRLDQIERIVKAQARVLEAQAELSKSTHEETRRIAQSPVSTNSVFSLNKSRFDQQDDLGEIDGTQVKAASTHWLAKGKIDINEAGAIEHRVNKNTLFKSGDNLDNKVEKLLKSMKKEDE